MIQEVDDEKFKKLMWQTYNFKNYESIEGLCSTLGVVRYGMLHVGHDTTDVGDDVTHVCARPVSLTFATHPYFTIIVDR